MGVPRSYSGPRAYPCSSFESARRRNGTSSARCGCCTSTRASHSGLGQRLSAAQRDPLEGERPLHAGSAPLQRVAGRVEPLAIRAAPVQREATINWTRQSPPTSDHAPATVRSDSLMTPEEARTAIRLLKEALGEKRVGYLLDLGRLELIPVLEGLFRDEKAYGTFDLSKEGDLQRLAGLIVQTHRAAGMGASSQAARLLSPRSGALSSMWNRRRRRISRRGLRCGTRTTSTRWGNTRRSASRTRTTRSSPNNSAS